MRSRTDGNESDGGRRIGSYLTHSIQGPGKTKSGLSRMSSSYPSTNNLDNHFLLPEAQISSKESVDVAALAVNDAITWG